MNVQYQKCGTCGKEDVEYHLNCPATKDCLACATTALEKREEALMAALNPEQQELLKKYTDAMRARSTIVLMMS